MQKESTNEYIQGVETDGNFILKLFNTNIVNR